MIKVIKPGFFSTIQDIGRIGYQKYGVIVSGVMDKVAYRIGNALLKQENTASIEMTLIGMTVEFQAPTQITLTGGMMQPKLNGKQIPMNKVIDIQSGDILSCGPIRHGARSYLCIKGGFLIDKVMGSRSTYIKAKIGGYHGRSLQSGDLIPYKAFVGHASVLHVQTKDFYFDAPIRILQGTEWDRFSEDVQQQFLQQSYLISLEADRMGYRLQNEQKIFLDKPFQLISEAVTFGTVQMPPKGEPIILMADRQTTGGYPKIAQVIAADLHRLAQKLPQQEITFELVTMQEAELAFIELEQSLVLLEKILKFH